MSRFAQLAILVLGFVCSVDGATCSSEATGSCHADSSRSSALFQRNTELQSTKALVGQSSAEGGNQTSGFTSFAGVQRHNSAGQCVAWGSIPEPLPSIFSERLGNSPWYVLKDGKCNEAIVTSAGVTYLGCSYSGGAGKCSCPQGCDVAKGGCMFSTPPPLGRNKGNPWVWPQFGPDGSMCDESHGYDSPSKKQCAKDADKEGSEYFMYDSKNSKCSVCPNGGCIAMTDTEGTFGKWAIYGPAPPPPCNPGCIASKKVSNKLCTKRKCRGCDFCKT